MTRLVCVRHGNTFLPDEEPRRVGGRTDLPLVPSGVAQAVALGRHLRDAGVRVARVYCSDLKRTRETAEIIVAEMGLALEPEVRAFLREVDYGPDENQPESLVKARLGDALARWEADGVVPDGWQFDRAATIRAWEAFCAEQAGHGEDGVTLVVTSNGIARFVLDVCAWERGLVASRKIRTGAFAEVDATADGNVLRRWDVRP